MHKILPLLLSILMACNQSHQSALTELSTSDTISHVSNSSLVSVKSEKLKNKSVIPEQIWSSDFIRIFGDSSIEKEKIYWSEMKFEPYLSFDDFLSDSVDLDLKKEEEELNWESNPTSYNFRTRIREGYSDESANFGLYFTLTYWGCGSPCQSGVLIDRRTGNIFNLPPAALGYDFRANSRLLIVNEPDSLGFYADCPYCKPEIHIWDDVNKKFNQRFSMY